MKVVQELLRHSNSSIKLDLYQQAGADAKRTVQGHVGGLFMMKKASSKSTRKQTKLPDSEGFLFTGLRLKSTLPIVRHKWSPQSPLVGVVSSAIATLFLASQPTKLVTSSRLALTVPTIQSRGTLMFNRRTFLKTGPAALPLATSLNALDPASPALR